MDKIENFLNRNDVFETQNFEHKKNFFNMIKSLTDFHKKNCQKYKNFIRLTFSSDLIRKIEDLPFLPVQIFKTNDLKSFTDKDTFKRFHHPEHQVQADLKFT